MSSLTKRAGHVKRAGLAAAGLSVALLVAACSSATSSSSSAASAAPSSAARASSGSVAPSLTVSDIDPSFSALKALAVLAPKGKGNVAVILPDTTSSTRLGRIRRAVPEGRVRGRRAAVGQPHRAERARQRATQVSMAQSAIAQGATVLIICPLDSGTGAHIEQIAKAAGVTVIDYDRLTLGGTRGYYVSFDNVKVGTVMGQGLVSCIKTGA